MSSVVKIMFKIIYILVFCPIVFSYPRLACPKGCRCTFDFTDCKAGGLVELPVGIDPNVTTLDLSMNEFSMVPTDLNQYKNLKNLNFSSNDVEVLTMKSPFPSLINLQQLDLSKNKINDWSDIESTILKYLRRLVFLDLSNNPIGSLILGNNNHGPGINSSVKILKLENCSFEKIDPSIFNVFPNLEELHMGRNLIKKLSPLSSNTLKFFDLSRCNLDVVKSMVFTNLTALDTLYMYKNLNLKNFSARSDSLQYLDLSDCNLESIPTGLLRKVYKANFHGNHLRSLLQTSFDAFPNLEQLDLSYNAISLIETGAFTKLSKIQIIDLSQNTLRSVDNAIFSGNLNLEVLNLSKNYFNSVPNLEQEVVKVVDLSSCEIQVFGSDALRDMTSLVHLNLSKNIIATLPDYIQAGNLRTLDLSVCRIKTVNNKTFVLLTVLDELNLAGNSLTSASAKAFYDISFIDLSDNNWRCDCAELHDLYNSLVEKRQRLDNLYCQSPEIVEGHSWLSACHSKWQGLNNNSDKVWWYTTGLIITIFVVLFILLAIRRVYLQKEKRVREATEARRLEERETLQRMRRFQLEAREEANRNAPDPRELQTPPSYNEALLLPKLDASHPSLSGSLHSLASKHSNGSMNDGTGRGRRRKRRRRRKSATIDRSYTPRATQTDTSEEELPPRALESDI